MSDGLVPGRAEIPRLVTPEPRVGDGSFYERRLHEVGAPSHSREELPGPEWRFLAELAIAYRNKDGRAIKKAARRAEENTFNKKRFYFYLEYSLEHAVRTTLVGELTREAVVALADEIHDRWSSVIRFDRTTLERMLLTACDLANPSEYITDNRAPASGAGALAMLIDDSGSLLQSIGQHLAEFLSDNPDVDAALDQHR